jgi:hypothetical protein
MEMGDIKQDLHMFTVRVTITRLRRNRAPTEDSRKADYQNGFPEEYRRFSSEYIATLSILMALVLMYCSYTKMDTA